MNPRGGVDEFFDMEEVYYIGKDGDLTQKVWKKVFDQVHQT